MASTPTLALTPLLQRYLEVLQHERKLSTHTLDAYQRDLYQLQQYADQEKQAVTTFSQEQLRRFVARLHNSGLAATSTARTLSAWRGFYTWLTTQTDSSLTTNPSTGLRAPRRHKRLPKALSVEHAIKLTQVSNNNPLALRDHALCELLYSSALRLSELILLDCRYFQTTTYQSQAWLNLAEAEVTVLGKGNKRRTVPVGKHACQALQAWLEVRNQFVRPKYTPDPYALFLSPRGTRIQARMVQRTIKALALAAGIPADVHPHVLRHSCASHLLQSSGDLRAVQEMLGHAQISTTQIYTALDFQHLAQIYDTAHPRAKRKT